MAGFIIRVTSHKFRWYWLTAFWQFAPTNDTSKCTTTKLRSIALPHSSWSARPTLQQYMNIRLIMIYTFFSAWYQQYLDQDCIPLELPPLPWMVRPHALGQRDQSRGNNSRACDMDQTLTGLIYMVWVFLSFSHPLHELWKNLGYYVFSVRFRASVVPLLFISCTSAVHLLSPCSSSHVLLFCLSSTSCTSLALSMFLYSSSAFHLRTLRRSQDAL